MNLYNEKSKLQQQKLVLESKKSSLAKKELRKRLKQQLMNSMPKMIENPLTLQKEKRVKVKKKMLEWRPWLAVLWLKLQAQSVQVLVV